MAKSRFKLSLVAVGATAVALSACGGGGSSTSTTSTMAPTPTPTPAPAPTTTPTPTPAPTPAPTAYSVTNLVSDQAGMAKVQDPNLVNAWGLVIAPNHPAWVADNGTNKSTLYDGNGAIQSLVVSIPPGQSTMNFAGGAANPTGIVFNGTTGFVVSQGGVSAAASFIYVGEEGTIAGWSHSVNATTAVTVVDNSVAGAVYKGAALYSPSSGPSLLFVADFHAGAVDVFDSTFKPTTVANGFVDPNTVAGYAPFNVALLNNMIFVAYAKQSTTTTSSGYYASTTTVGVNEVDGAGLGYVDEFDTTGKFVMRFDAPGGNLNAPWGMAIAPSNFGTLSGDLLVGNFGDGTISAYNPASGAYMGKMVTAMNAQVVIQGLWGLSFGNGFDVQPTNTLFFAAGPGNEAHGLYGRIDLPGTYTPPT